MFDKHLIKSTANSAGRKADGKSTVPGSVEKCGRSLMIQTHAADGKSRKAQ